MSDSGSGFGALPPDQHVRDRIATDLETNLLVEAGAGSGKTTAMVERMVALVAAGVGVGEIAAVTFTRKAATQLRERFRDRLERVLLDLRREDEAYDRILNALREVERGFVGTIHSFCSKLLRERPLEAGLDPAFEELMEAEHAAAVRTFWRAHLDRLTASEDALLEGILAVGIRPRDLQAAFERVVENPDVDFPAEPVDPPSLEELEPVREALDEWLDRALALMPQEKPGKGWDDLQKKVRELRYSRTNDDWDSLAGLLAGLGIIATWRPKLVQNRWGSSSVEKARAKGLKEDLEALVAETALSSLIDQWMAHRYVPAMGFVHEAAEQFAEYRRRTGVMSFQDLLSVTASLLRRNATVRADLGRRYPRILIDEFQDTDPIQAEIAFLLASDPSEADAVADWGTAEPRPGALFVVGDPKQSIYRFRRADVVLYEAVRDRFETFGDVVRLRSNFRSTPDIAGIVNDVFGAVFPAEGDRYQPRAATMLPQRDPALALSTGVFRHRLPKPDGRTRLDQAFEDAQRIAAWIRRRVDRGERRAQDFMILTKRKRWLHLYARALDDVGVPAEVTGARVEVERGLEELVMVLRALSDPGNAVSTVAVLTGLFFGLDLDQLVEHRLAGGYFDCRKAPEATASDVDVALHTMARWWRLSRETPADIFLAKFADEVGILADAAAGELGSLRTGVLMYALDAVRRAALAGDSTIVGAIEALENAIAWSEAETPMQPGRGSAVQVMNVHKAKGLESPVVILASDWETDFPPEIHVSRTDGTRAEGFMEIWTGQIWARTALAYPVGWHDRAAEERRFTAAEDQRLRYVAATRAGEELVVATREGNRKSPWALFEPWLEEHATDLGELPPFSPQPSVELPVTGSEIVSACQRTSAIRAERGMPTYLFRSVTEAAKTAGGPRPAASPELATATQIATATARSSDSVHDGDDPRGPEWGSVVHAALATTGEQDGDSLEALCRTLLVKYGRPVAPDGDPVELADLVGMVERVRASDLWARAWRTRRPLIEVPFQVALDGERPNDSLGAADGMVPSFLEGVLDLAFREEGGWVIADYKTDIGDDPDFADRSIAYQAQVDLYADAWTRLTGEPVKERVLFYTAQNRTETW